MLKINDMKKLIEIVKNWIKGLLHVEYRLSIYYMCKLVHLTGSTVEEVLLQADLTMPQRWREKGVWTLYKTGPLYLAEREVDGNGWWPE